MKIIDKINNFIDKTEAQNELKKQFDKQAAEFIVLSKEDPSASYLIKAIKFPESSSALIMKNENVLPGMIIIDHNKVAYKITDLDSNLFDYPPDGTSDYHLSCKKFFYKLYEKPVYNQQTINNTVNISGNHNNVGSITINSSTLDALSEIEKAIKSSSTSFFHKKNQKDALILFASFKDCVLQQKRDDGLFAKFLKVMEAIVSSTIIGLVQGLIASIPH